ncbi:MAG: hypothetical protein ACRD2X_07770 [Vicinamibacteraceae bacterium]
MSMWIPPSDEEREAGRYPQRGPRLSLRPIGALFVALCRLALALLVLAFLGIRVL